MISDSIFKISNSPPEYLDLAFGKEGVSLLSFLKKVDPDHPGIKEIGLNFDLLCQYLDLIIYLKNNKMNFALNLLQEKCKNSLSESIKCFDDPSRTRRYFRFLSNELYYLRSKKKIKSITSNFFHEKASKIWSACPSDFCLYEDKVWLNEIEKNKSKAEFFQKIGCKELSNVISEFSNIFSCGEYYGFRKIDIFYSCVVLAKMQKFILHDKKIKIKTTKGSYLYSPIISSIFSFRNIPKNIKEIIDELDNHKENFFKPIFDNYLVLMPYFGKQIVDFPSPFVNFDVNFNFKDLFERQLVNFIILGEKDKSCYFICGAP